ncbi:hypothetical protein [Micromonospora sp. NPDC005324]|uniref:hypothetical protein n=1 Tax=Micromonospora sp. NPDC005324 TaxID=3157033 RepID=UPI0033AFC4EE
MTTHGPVLPNWSCGGCYAPWPCRTRQRELRADYDQEVWDEQVRQHTHGHLRNERPRVRIQHLV